MRTTEGGEGLGGARVKLRIRVRVEVKVRLGVKVGVRFRSERWVV
jgi:hypothetical protein